VDDGVRRSLIPDSVGCVDPVEVLRELGGVARRRDLLRLTTRKRLHGAVRRGEIMRTGRGIYRLASADLALVRAAELRGAASHLSAATLHGWEVAFPATCPWVTVPRNVGVSDPDECIVFWADLSGEGPVTSPVRTVIDCARRLEFGPALAVADSALRHGDVTPTELARAAAEVRGKGAAQARRVAAHASGLAANPFESMLRAIALEAGLAVEPQVGISLGPDGVVHPDAVDSGRRIVLEADSWEFHAGRDAHARDCRRYTLLVVHGWMVLRFTWRQVMHETDFVRWCLVWLVGGTPTRRTPPDPGPTTCRATRSP
jgi:very-short-patch-repair endonuclease